MNDTALNKLSVLLNYLEGAYATNTLRAYRADMSEFIQYASRSNSESLPASPGTVAKFLESVNDGSLKSSTIKRKAASISAVHRLSSHTDPTRSLEVQLALRKIYRQLGNRYGQAYPITRPILDQLLAVCGSDLRGKRNRALLLLAYDSMRRRAELVSLRIDDMELQLDGGASILLRKSKTDQARTGQWIHLSHESTAAVEAWLQEAGITEGFVLRGIDTRGQITASLCDSRVGKIYKSLAKLARLEDRVIQQISGHSMRVGAAQDLLFRGASLPQIMVKGGWAKPDTVIRYVERVHRRTIALR